MLCQTQGNRRLTEQFRDDRLRASFGRSRDHDPVKRKRLGCHCVLARSAGIGMLPCVQPFSGISDEDVLDSGGATWCIRGLQGEELLPFWRMVSSLVQFGFQHPSIFIPFVGSS